jgi:hypothetical protein
MSDYSSIAYTIDKIREGIREVTDDSVYSDEYIYSLCLDVRMTLMNRELNKNRFMSPFVYKGACIPLAIASDIPCNCVPQHLGCKVLKSTQKIPKSITHESGDTLRVFSIDRSSEYKVTEPKVGKHNKYSRNPIRPYASIYNEYLYVIGYPDNKLRDILIEMIPEDPTSFAGLTNCQGGCSDSAQSPSSCYDPTRDTFNITGHLLESLVDTVIEKITERTKKQFEDITNNAQSTPAAQQI